MNDEQWTMAGEEIPHFESRFWVSRGFLACEQKGQIY